MLWKRRIIRWMLTLVELIIASLLIISLLRVIVPTASLISEVDGDSMLPTLEDEQIVFADMAPITHESIVIAHYSEENETIIVKRVIGMPGDRIRITQDGIYRNGILLEEDYLPEENRAKTYREKGYNDITLGEDEYYLLGDNREISLDSRSFGAVKEEMIIYKYSETVTSNVVIRFALCIGVAGGLLMCEFKFSKKLRHMMLKCIFAQMRKNRK